MQRGSGSWPASSWTCMGCPRETVRRRRTNWPSLAAIRMRKPFSATVTKSVRSRGHTSTRQFASRRQALAKRPDRCARTVESPWREAMEEAAAENPGEDAGGDVDVDVDVDVDADAGKDAAEVMGKTSGKTSGRTTGETTAEDAGQTTSEETEDATTEDTRQDVWKAGSEAGREDVWENAREDACACKDAWSCMHGNEGEHPREDAA